jgi:hypothetical protein
MPIIRTTVTVKEREQIIRAARRNRMTLAEYSRLRHGLTPTVPTRLQGTSGAMRGAMTARLAELPELVRSEPRTKLELAEHFSVTPKTITRAMTALMRVQPIEKTRDGRKTLYKWRT